MEKRIYIYTLALEVLVTLAVVCGFIIVFFSPVLIECETIIIRVQTETAQHFFPTLYAVWISLTLLASIGGSILMIWLFFRLIKWLWLLLPPYIDYKQAYLKAFLLNFISLICILGFVGCEFALRSKSNPKALIFFGCNLKSAEYWQQKDTSDERGMNFAKPTYNWTDTFHFINKQGFLARWDYDKETIDSFKKLGYKIVFIIGDSYAEGVTSGSWDKTFCELVKPQLLKRNVLLCPLAVGGTDVVQYRLVAEKYIPMLQPDLVIIAFCGCNDFLLFDRVPTPYVPLSYQTNMGYANSNIGWNQIICATPDSLYRYYRKITPSIGPSYLLTYIYATFTGWTPPKYKNLNSDTSTTTYRNLTVVKNLTQMNNGRFIIVFTPAFKFPTLRSQAQADSLYSAKFNDLQQYVHYYLKGDITYRDYISQENQHFNDIGNEKFANFLMETIISNMSIL